MHWAKLALCVVGTVGLFTSVAQAEMTANLWLELRGGLRTEGDEPRDLTIELPVRNGDWTGECWGWAFALSHGQHRGVVTSSELVNGVRKLTIEMKIGRDYWVRGGKATYHIDLQPARQGGEWTGTFTGEYTILNEPQPTAPQRGEKKKTERELSPEAEAFIRALKKEQQSKKEEPPTEEQTFKVSGEVRGSTQPAWPGKVEDFTPLKATEHPRLIFRTSDLSRMRDRATHTPEGQAIMKRFWAVLGTGDRSGHKFGSWPAVGYGFAYQMTGEQKYADTAKQIIKEEFFEGLPAGGQDIHHGPRLQGLALAFDLACDGWDEAFRRKCVDEIRQRTLECATGTFGRGKMGGLNLSPWSNHNGIRAAAYGLGALAIIGEPGSDGEVWDEARDYADRAALEVRHYLRFGLGGGAWAIEGMFYKGMTMRRGLNHFIAAYPIATGNIIDASPYGDFMTTGYFLEAEPGSVFPHPKGYDGIGRDYGVDGDDLRDLVWTIGLPAVPGSHMPGVKWLLERNAGLQGDKTYGISDGIYAPYALAFHPFEVSEQHPNEAFPWLSPDPQKGHYVFRPRWKDKDDTLLVLNLNSETLRACHHERIGPTSNLLLWSQGTRWIDAPYLVRTDNPDALNDKVGPVVTHQQLGKDRTCVLTMDLRQLYQQLPGKGQKPTGQAIVRRDGWEAMADHGMRGTRHMAIDCSGKSGTPLLVAILDQVHHVDVNGETSKPQATWQLPIERDAGKLEVDGQHFRVNSSNGATLRGLLLTPTLSEGKGITADNAATTFVLFTVSKEQVPPMLITGEGLDARITIGQRTVRFDGKTLVLE